MYLTDDLLKFFKSLKGSFLEAMLSLYEFRNSEGVDPLSCPYFKKAERLAYEEGEIDRLISGMKYIIKKYEQHNGQQQDQSSSSQAE